MHDAMENNLDPNQLEEIRQAAQAISSSPGMDWVTFFKHVLGLNGIVRRYYPTREALKQFEQTPTYIELQQMLAQLRSSERTTEKVEPQEPIRVVTVRLPKSLHESLRAEAHEHRTSMNKLCISKLLLYIENEFVPVD